MEKIKGYKVFNQYWVCKGFQYTCPGIFEMNSKPVICQNGFHFCKNLSDCFEYYSFNFKNKVAEVIALGEVDSDGQKFCTNKIKIVREIPWEEVLCIVNTGNCNTGNRNTGDWNTGNRNTGDWNTGGCNTGNWNTGDYNTGDCNTGSWNTGDWNTGNCNTGDWNTGDWNKSSFNTGCFMTKDSKISMFNKPSDLSYMNWFNSYAKRLLDSIPKTVVEWIYSEDMTDEEKEENPTYKTTGGYLKVLDEFECGQLWWNGLTSQEQDTIKKLPNFDPEIFWQCTGINVRE